MPESIAIESLPSTSSLTIKRFKSLGVNTYLDLVNYFPSRYEDFSLLTSIGSAQPGETVTVKGEVTDSKYQVTRTGLRLQVFKLKASSKRERCVREIICFYRHIAGTELNGRTSATEQSGWPYFLSRVTAKRQMPTDNKSLPALSLPLRQAGCIKYGRTRRVRV